MGPVASIPAVSPGDKYTLSLLCKRIRFLCVPGYFCVPAGDHFLILKFSSALWEWRKWRHYTYLIILFGIISFNFPFPWQRRLLLWIFLRPNWQVGNLWFCQEIPRTLLGLPHMGIIYVRLPTYGMWRCWSVTTELCKSSKTTGTYKTVHGR